MKYILLKNDTIEIDGRKLFRIKAVRDFGNVKKGDLGGYIEKEANLSHDYNAWVCGKAKVFDNAKVFGNAWVYGDAVVYGKAKVYGDAVVYGKAKVYGDAVVYGNAVVCDNAWVSGDAEVRSVSDYIVFKNFWSSGRYFTYTKSNKKWAVGCFYGTGEELIEKAYKDSEESGKFYEKYVNFVKELEDVEK